MQAAAEHDVAAEENDLDDPSACFQWKLARQVSRSNDTLYSRLQSIRQDARFVAQVASVLAGIPMLGNLRNGRWYAPSFDDTCHFKSGDGHYGVWAFSLPRLNLHVARLAAKHGMVAVVDSTRRGKSLPDSLSRTIPMWCCTLNHCVAAVQRSLHEGSGIEAYSDWDQIHVPPDVVSDSERDIMLSRVRDMHVPALQQSGVNLEPLARAMSKPLRCVWMRPSSRLWENVPADLPFHAVVCISASDNARSSADRTHGAWDYLPGAGDDEEAWSGGLSAPLFWRHVDHLLPESEPNAAELCSTRAQAVVTAAASAEASGDLASLPGVSAPSLTWIDGLDPPLLAVGNLAAALPDNRVWQHVDALVNVGAPRPQYPADVLNAGLVLNLDVPKASGKSKQKHALEVVLRTAVDWVHAHLCGGRRVLIHSFDGRNRCLAVAVAVCASCLRADGSGILQQQRPVTELSKAAMRREQARICTLVPQGCIDRALMQQVNRVYFSPPRGVLK